MTAIVIRSCRAPAVLAFALLSGCSGYLESEHYEIVNDGTFVRFRIHDWYEEETTGPSIGVYRPPVFGFEKDGQLYAIYPVFIVAGGLIGPPLASFVPLSLLGDSLGQDESMVLRVRHSPQGLPSVRPTTIVVTQPSTIAISLERGATDAVGTIYSTTLPISKADSRFTILLRLSDNSSRKIEFAYRLDRFYSPLFSFNGPEPRPSFARYPE